MTTRMIQLRAAALILFACMLAGRSAWSQEAERAAVILDTDIGTGIDDAVALALLVASPEVELLGVTTCGGDAQRRALVVCRLLTCVERTKVPIAWGRGRQPDYGLDEQVQYARHPAVVFNRTSKPTEQPAVEFLHEQLKARPGEIVILATGPLTNVAQLLAEHPDAKGRIKRIVISGGSVGSAAAGKEAAGRKPLSTLQADLEAARRVLASGVPLTYVASAENGRLALRSEDARRMFAPYSRLTMQVQALYQLSGESDPPLHAALAAAATFNDELFTADEKALRLDADGNLQPVEGEPRARIVAAKQGRDFVAWCAKRIAAYSSPLLPNPPQNISQLVPRRGMPYRVHAIENFETDIERRWWLAGKLETNQVPPGSRRALRGTLTQDFDDRMGDTKTMYTAVVFNPVPGPPMGQRTRLSFRYRLQGADTLRVQLYSLSNGYHRYLALENLPQGKWQSATVDMTQMRRPDGSGGPLAEDERIDDIQFYADPRAELLIDDIVLYDEAPEGETRPFPKQVLFTGWFDTGKQGQEWPGTFEIVPHEKPLTWKAARSVPHEERESAWIRVGLRGLRPLPAQTELRFRYRLTGGESLRVAVAGPEGKSEQQVENPTLGRWTEATLRFSRDETASLPAQADEIHFVVPRQAELLVDDVLLYEPGE